MGTDKAMLTLHGRPLVEHAVRLLQTLTDNVSILGSRPDLESYAPIVPDFRQNCGPLSGIEAALSVTPAYALFLPVDLPLLPAVLLHLMLRRVSQTGALATVPRFAGAVQPLCAVYHHSLLPGIRAALNAGDYKVMRVIERTAMSTQPRGALDLFDLETVLAVEDRALWPVRTHDFFLNCNTPGEYAKLAQQVK